MALIKFTLKGDNSNNETFDKQYDGLIECLDDYKIHCIYGDYDLYMHGIDRDGNITEISP